MAKKRPQNQPPQVGTITPDLLPLAVPIDSLTPDPHNAKDHGQASVEAIKASLKKFGQVKPIVVNRETSIIEAGNGTWTAAKELGWTQIAAVKVDHDPATATGYAIADNRSAEFADWNVDRLIAAADAIDEFDPDLALALKLDELLPSTAPPDESTIEIPEKFGILLECRSEAEQREVFQRLQAGKFPPAKVLTI